MSFRQPENQKICLQKWAANENDQDGDDDDNDNDDENDNEDDNGDNNDDDDDRPFYNQRPGKLVYRSGLLPRAWNIQNNQFRNSQYPPCKVKVEVQDQTVQYFLYLEYYHVLFHKKCLGPIPMTPNILHIGEKGEEKTYKKFRFPFTSTDDDNLV